MVQTIKAYKNMKTTLKAYKSNMGTNHQKKNKKTECQHINIYVNQSTTKAKKKKIIYIYIYIYNHQSIVTMTKNIYKLGCPKVCESVCHSFFFLSTQLPLSLCILPFVLLSPFQCALPLFGMNS